MNVCPATLIVPVLDAPLLAATLNDTGAAPLPDAPAVTAIQESFDTAVQAHAAPAVTAIVPGPPEAAIVCPDG